LFHSPGIQLSCKKNEESFELGIFSMKIFLS